MLKSALTASLTGNAPTPAQIPQKKVSLSPDAFPCIAFADEVTGTSANSAAQEPLPDDEELLAGVEIVGSAPTVAMLPNGTSLVRALHHRDTGK